MHEIWQAVTLDEFRDNGSVLIKDSITSKPFSDDLYNNFRKYFDLK